MTCGFTAAGQLRGHLFRHGLADLGDIGHHVGRHGDFQRCFVAGLMDLDGELGQIEQPLQRLGPG
jgi:hypothetical protein